MTSYVGRIHIGKLSLRVGALSLLHGSTEEEVTCSLRNGQAGFTAVTLCYLGHSVSLPP